MNPASLAPNIPEITLDQLRPIPEPWQDVSLQGCLIEASAIARRIQDLARQIEQNADPGAPLVVISILAGAAIFSSDLIRALRCPLEWTMIGLSSYREGTTSGDLHWTLPLTRDIRGQQVLIVDDILDTGQTLQAVVEHLHTLRPASVQTCVLLDKQISVQQTTRHPPGFRQITWVFRLRMLLSWDTDWTWGTIPSASVRCHALPKAPLTRIA